MPDPPIRTVSEQSEEVIAAQGPRDDRLMTLSQSRIARVGCWQKFGNICLDTQLELAICFREWPLWVLKLLHRALLIEMFRPDRIHDLHHFNLAAARHNRHHFP
jgi:hypothetical protein